MNQQPTFAPPYKVVNNCLLETRSGGKGPYDVPLCNFVPWVSREIIEDDGERTTSRIALRGIREDGEPLPEIEIASGELGSFNWLCSSWGIQCILGAGSSVKEALRIAIQRTAANAPVVTTYTTTGWRKLEGTWHFLMPGDETHTVRLQGRSKQYFLEGPASAADLRELGRLFSSPPVPERIWLPLLAMVFLSPLNSFLKLAGHEPKFPLVLYGKTGSRKSTIAALLLSFFGDFTGADLPLSFRDTRNSIIGNSFYLKDILTCIDDLHPATAKEERELTATAQAVMRAYGDRQGRGRLNKDSTVMESRAPQGNAIITAEYLPDIGSSGAARYFPLELREEDVDLDRLSQCQELAARGVLRRCMQSYTDWLRDTYLATQEQETSFLRSLGDEFKAFRNAFLQWGIRCHGRIPETVSWLQMGLRYFLYFLRDNEIVSREETDDAEMRMELLLHILARKQGARVEQDRPSHVFVRKLNALAEMGQFKFVPMDQVYQIAPEQAHGYEDDTFFYFGKDETHRLVRKLCSEQGENFTISVEELLHAMAQEGLIRSENGKTTFQIRFGEKLRRVVCLYKSKARTILEASE